MAYARPRPKKYLRKLALRQPCEHGPMGLELKPYQVVIRPLVTEKGTHQSARYNGYSFVVHPKATKDQIKKAIQELFNVRVDKVTTQIRHGKLARFRQKLGNRPDWKKALVTLNPEDKIEFF
jgi:large subunit ribosomal protein L23